MCYTHSSPQVECAGSPPRYEVVNMTYLVHQRTLTLIASEVCTLAWWVRPLPLLLPLALPIDALLLRIAVSVTATAHPSLTRSLANRSTPPKARSRVVVNRLIRTRAWFDSRRTSCRRRHITLVTLLWRGWTIEACTERVAMQSRTDIRPYSTCSASHKSNCNHRTLDKSIDRPVGSRMKTREDFATGSPGQMLVILGILVASAFQGTFVIVPLIEYDLTRSITCIHFGSKK